MFLVLFLDRPLIGSTLPQDIQISKALGCYKYWRWAWYQICLACLCNPRFKNWKDARIFLTSQPTTVDLTVCRQ